MHRQFLDFTMKTCKDQWDCDVVNYHFHYSSKTFLYSSTQTFEWMQNVSKMAIVGYCKSQKCTLAQEIWSGSLDQFFSKSVVKSGHETTAHSCTIATTLPSNPIEVTTIVFIVHTILSSRRILSKHRLHINLDIYEPQLLRYIETKTISSLFGHCLGWAYFMKQTSLVTVGRYKFSDWEEQKFWLQ